MFTPIAIQTAGIVQDSLYMNFDLQSGQLNTLVPNSGANFQDSVYNSPLRITSGSFVKSLATPAYIDFQSVSTGSQIWPTNASGAGIGYNFLTSTSWTMQAWTWWDAITGDICLISQGALANDQGFHVIARSNKLGFNLFNNDLSSIADLPQNRWVNIALVYNRRTGFRKEIYFNGVLDNAANGNQYGGGATAPNNTTIGFINWIGYSGNPWNGRLGQMLWYGKALTSSEIRQNYDATKQIYGVL
jgi:hypothetical protein